MIFNSEINRIMAKHDLTYSIYDRATAPLLRKMYLFHRAAFQRALLKRNGNSRYAEFEVPAGFRLRLDLTNPADVDMLLELQRFGLYERPTSILVQQTLGPGEVFVDVGANIGYYSLLASVSLGQTGKVIAFEPLPIALERFYLNVELNNFNNIAILPKAVLNRQGEAQLNVSTLKDSMSSLRDYQPSCKSIRVETVTLDRALADERISLLKVDAEGTEPEILDGATEIFRSGRCRRAIIEWVKHSQQTSGDLDRTFKQYTKLGRVYVIAASRVGSGYSLVGPISRRRDLPLSCNLLLVPQPRSD